MLELNGFWSYVHLDDEAECGRIIKLAKDLKSQYELISGETLDLIYDQEYLKWGNQWLKRIDEALASAAFFIPVLTPNYFRSSECRRELQYFAKASIEKGYEDIVLPILYVDFHELHNDKSDDLIKLVRKFQWEDWKEIRFKEINSEIYRKRVAQLAETLIEKYKKFITPQEKQQNSANDVELKSQEEFESNEPGTMEILAKFEETLPKWSTSMTEIAGDIQTINVILVKSTTEVDAANREDNVFASRLRIAKKLSKELTDPVEKIYSNANTFISQLYDIDRGIEIMLDQIQKNDEKEGPQIMEFFESIRNLESNYNSALDSLELLISSIKPIENLSRDLRTVLQRFKQGLNIIIEAKEPINRWIKRIDSITL